MNSFNSLVSNIQQIHMHLQKSAVNTVNQMLTIRNWLIGYHIVEFEQKGKERAEYGDMLIESLAAKLTNIKGIDKRSLFRFRQFYLYYPQLALPIRGSLSPELKDDRIVGTVSPVLDIDLALSNIQN